MVVGQKTNNGEAWVTNKLQAYFNTAHKLRFTKLAALGFL
jgi:hypothetical protein